MSRVVKVVLFLVAFAAFVALCFTVIFPWVDRTLITDPTLEAMRAGILA